MINPQALQPVLAAGNVAMLKQYIEALTPLDPPDALAADYADGYADGYRAAVRGAVHLVDDMWRAAVIATDSVNMEMMQDMYPGDFELEYDDDKD